MVHSTNWVESLREQHRELMRPATCQTMPAVAGRYVPLVACPTASTEKGPCSARSVLRRWHLARVLKSETGSDDQRTGNARQWGREGCRTWSWLPTSISVGCVHSRNCSSTEFRATTGSAPRACQKSPGTPATVGLSPLGESRPCACRASWCRRCRVE